MSKYEKLASFLGKLECDRWRADFAKIESVLGFELPQSARNHNAWWANQAGAGHSQTAGWLPAGWRTQDVDLSGEKVTFVRSDTASSESLDGPPPMRSDEPDYSSIGLSIPQAKKALAAYYQTDVANIEIVIRG